MNCLSLIKSHISKDNDWLPILLSYDYSSIDTLLTAECVTYYPDIRIFPDQDNIFRAFELCPLHQLRIVFLGMDPYINIKHNKLTDTDEPEANGLAFSVNEGIPAPPSLKNLLKEMQTDVGATTGAISTCSDFTYLAKQGILFLNAALTVRQHKTGSHSKIWKHFTDWIIQQISTRKSGVVFILLGKCAQEKATCIDSEKHTLIQEVHPSPLSASRGFFGSKIYSKCNTALGKNPIQWVYGS